jgi:hypothetical protein
MKKIRDEAPDSSLRLRAKTHLKKKPQKKGAAAKETDTQKLLHELQVHQIELEIQNEELMRARAEREALLAKYTDLYDFAPVGYLTLARDGSVLQVNLTGARLLGVERSRLLRRPFQSLVTEGTRADFYDFLAKVFSSQVRKTCEIAILQEKSLVRPLYIQFEALASDGGDECRAVFVDVTDLHRFEAEKVLLIRELQETVRKVKTLSGLLPICASCKKVRNDQGYWEQIEVYIRSHSEADFSHGMCPECFARLYPEFLKTDRDEGGEKT